jgi:hypothetical protein
MFSSYDNSYTWESDRTHSKGRRGWTEIYVNNLFSLDLFDISNAETENRMTNGQR